MKLVALVSHIYYVYISVYSYQHRFHFQTDSTTPFCAMVLDRLEFSFAYTRVGTLIVPTIYLQLIQNRYMFRSFTVLQCSHQHCVQHVASDVEVVG